MVLTQSQLKRIFNLLSPLSSRLAPCEVLVTMIGLPTEDQLNIHPPEDCADPTNPANPLTPLRPGTLEHEGDVTPVMLCAES